MQTNSLAVAVFVCLFAGCEASVVVSDAGPSAIETRPEDDAGTQVDSGIPEQMDASVKRGQILLYQSTFDAGVTSVLTAIASASFTELPHCQRETIGNCSVTSCPDGLSGQPPSHHAGVVTINGTEIDGGVRLVPPSSGEIFQGQQFWSQPHQRLEIHAAGGIVPAFDMALLSPGEVTFTHLPCATAACAVLRSQPLTLSWTGRPPDTSIAVTLSTASITSMVMLECETPATAGTLELPVAALSRLQPSAMASLTIHTVGQTTIWLQDWEIKALATQNPESRQVSIQ